MHSQMIDTAQSFYAQLSANNTKAWWDEHRETYDDHLKPAALALLERLTPQVADLMGHPIKPKLFRPHRDVRFSKDKTPYNSHLHMMWQVIEDDAQQCPVYFFGIGVDYVTAGAGIMSFDKPVLDNWRKFVDLDQPHIASIMAQLKSDGYDLRPPALKRVPVPFPADHASADLLRMKAVVASRDIGKAYEPDSGLIAAFAKLTPLNKLLLQVAT